MKGKLQSYKFLLNGSGKAPVGTGVPFEQTPCKKRFAPSARHSNWMDAPTHCTSLAPPTTNYNWPNKSNHSKETTPLKTSISCPSFGSGMDLPGIQEIQERTHPGNRRIVPLSILLPSPSQRIHHIHHQKTHQNPTILTVQHGLLQQRHAYPSFEQNNTRSHWPGYKWIIRRMDDTDKQFHTMQS